MNADTIEKARANVIARTAVNTIEWVPLSHITTDHAVNTRPVDTAWVDRHLPVFDPDKLGVPIVSRRADGSYVWLDGQNRGELCRRAGWGDQKLQCRVFTGLTTAEEAELFLGHNDNRTVKTYYKFMARITAGEPKAVAIQKILQHSGWNLSYFPGDSRVVAVVALEKVYEEGARLHPDTPGAALVSTFEIITHAWGYGQDTPNGAIVQGLGSVLNRYGVDVDMSSLTRRLASYPGGALGLLGNARGLRAFAGGTVSSCVAETIVQTYNRRRTTGRIPEWRSSAPRPNASGESE